MTTQGPADPVTLDVLAAEAGVAVHKVRRWVRRAGVAVWHVPSDRRRLLVDRGEFERLMSPRLVRGGEGAASGA